MGRFGQGPGFPGRWSEAQRIHKHEEAFPCSSGSHQGFKPHVVWGFGIFLCPSPSSPFHPTLLATTRNPSPVEFSPSLPSPLLLALLLWPLGPEKSSASFFFPSPLLLAPERVVRLSIIHSVPPGFRLDFLGGATWLLLIPQAEYLLDNPLWATNDSLFVQVWFLFMLVMLTVTSLSVSISREGIWEEGKISILPRWCHGRVCLPMQEMQELWVSRVWKIPGGGHGNPLQ